MINMRSVPQCASLSIDGGDNDSPKANKVLFDSFYHPHALLRISCSFRLFHDHPLPFSLSCMSLSPSFTSFFSNHFPVLFFLLHLHFFFTFSCMIFLASLFSRAFLNSLLFSVSFLFIFLFLFFFYMSFYFWFTFFSSTLSGTSISFSSAAKL